ncbi:MAG: HEPN domain-containing protein [Saprospiraceae bacterium]|nr:HEPN domain-containing protein [Lewinella sp.]
MDTYKVDELLQEADQLLQFAGEEMVRSEEDAITHTVCFHSRQAIINYLTAFLLSEGIQPEEPITMAGLLEECRSLDGRFELVDLNNIHCRLESHSQEYCLSVDQVDECIKIARQLRAIVNATTPGY